jgi:fucose permease
LAKWIETGGAGTLGDTVMTELNGNIGVGNPNPASLLHIGQFNGYGATTGLLLGNNLLGSTFDRSHADSAGASSQSGHQHESWLTRYRPLTRA